MTATPLPRCHRHQVPLAYADYGNDLVGELFCNECEDENVAILGPIGVLDGPVGMFDGMVEDA